MVMGVYVCMYVRIYASYLWEYLHTYVTEYSFVVWMFYVHMYHEIKQTVTATDWLEENVNFT